MHSSRSGSGAPLLPRINLGDTLDIVDLTSPHGYEACHTPPAGGHSDSSIFEEREHAPPPLRKHAPSTHNSITSSVVSKEKPAHDETDKEKAASTWAYICGNTWAIECLNMAFSLSCMAAIIIVLYVYNGKELLPMPWGLTLNAIVSILATGTETSLVCVIASTISQLKWDWFRKRRKLAELQILDDASRGAFGALNMLAKRIGNTIAIIGAAITVLSLIFDPFVQQVIRYPTRTTSASDGIASTRKASGFKPLWGGVDMLSAMNAGIWADASQFARTPVCTSGNCKWPAFESLGWCSKCEDVTSRATLSSGCKSINTRPAQESTNCTLSLGSGAEKTVASRKFYYESGALITVVNQIVWTTYSIKRHVEMLNPKRLRMELINQTMLGIQSPALVLGYAQIEDEWKGDPRKDALKLRVTQAEQCALTPCVREYSMQMSSGSLQAHVTSINYGVILERDFPFYDPNTTIRRIRESCWQPDSRNVTYTFAGHDALSRDCDAYGCLYWANTSLSAFCPVAEYARQMAPYFGSTSKREWWPENGIGGWTETFYSSDTIRRVAAHNLSYVTANVAAALTALALDGSNETVRGTVEMSKSYIEVRWDWLIYPIILELTGLLIFGMAVVQTRKHKTILWRSSLLPLLFHGFERNALDERPVPLDIAGMEKRAEDMHAMLTINKADTALHVD